LSIAIGFFVTLKKPIAFFLDCTKLTYCPTAELRINYAGKELTSKKSSETLRSNLPFGELFVEQRSTANYYTPYKFSGKEKDEETSYSYFGARYYMSDVSIWLSVDPLAENYPKMSPYMYCAGNPIMLVDPDGRSTNPIYDYEGNFLGPDDWGMQGDAIVMNKSDYTPGMSHENAVTKGRYLDNLPKCMSSAAMSELKANIDLHFSTIPSRPDYDGFITIDEGIAWAKEHPGAKYNPTAENTLYADAYYLDFGNTSASNLVENKAKAVNLFNAGNFAKSAFNSRLRSTIYALGRVNLVLLNSEVGSVKVVNDDAAIYDWNTGGGFIRSSFINTERKRTGLSDEHGFKVFYYGKGFLNK